MSNRNRLRFITVGLISTALMSIGSALAWADDGSIVLDFIRHGEAGDNTVVNTLVPGPDLTGAGEVQAQDLVSALSGNGIDDIYASAMIRSQVNASSNPPPNVTPFTAAIVAPTLVPFESSM